MKKLICFYFVIFISYSMSAMEISHGQVNNIKVFLDRNASVAEQYAANELRTFIEQATGVPLQVVRERWGGRTHIYVGVSDEVRTLLPDVDFDKMAPDEILIRHLPSDELIIAGGAPRGTLYAVYTFLEEQANIRFWTSRETMVPKVDKISFSGYNRSYKPQLTAREIFTHDLILHPAFAARMKVNGDCATMPMAPYGGNIEIIGVVHTFDRYIPAKVYLEKHPEWFSLIDGKRVGGQHVGQLCLTNDEMRKTLTAKMLDILRKHPDPHIIELSQNDGAYELCQCDKCKAIIAEEGAQSGLLLRFVNQVTEDINKEFPHVKVMTLAYFFTSTPPKITKPGPNVIIRLCTPECNLSQPLNSPVNDVFRKQLEGWSKISSEMAIWHYQINFGAYLMPFPNIRFFADDIRYLVANNVTSILLQNDYGSGGVVGDFMALRTWVNAKLAWDPSLDLNQLLDEFINGYYGKKAAPYMRQYLDFMEKTQAESGGRLDYLGGSPSDWLSHANLKKADDLMNQALLAAQKETDPIYFSRVEIASLAIKMTWLDRYHWILLFNELPVEDLPLKGDLNTYRDDCRKLAEKYGVNFYSEAKTFKTYMDELIEKQKIVDIKIPKEFESVARGNVVVLDRSQIVFIIDNKQSFLIDDADSRSGKVMKLTNGVAGWYIQGFLYGGMTGEKWQLYVYAKADTSAPDSDALKVGIYDRRDKIDRFNFIKGKQFVPGKYSWVDCGVWDIPPQAQLYFAPVDAKGFKSVNIDQIVLVKK